MKKYKVYITQSYEPIEVIADSPEQAEEKVQNDHVWGEPTDVELLAVGIYDSKPTEINTKDKQWSKKL
tara:strand:- start:565 stop:768 length:204 start_codon:yes stop_codon:yes gene_type:complete